MEKLTKTENNFSHEIFGKLTTITNENNEAYFISNEVSEILGYSANKKLLERLDEDEKILLNHSESVSVLNGYNIYSCGVQLLTESGLYSAIVGSKKLGKKKKELFISELKYQIGIFDKINLRSVKEADFLDLLEETIAPFGLKLQKQVSINQYNIDAVINKVAIEYDENNHNHYNKEKELSRERVILSKYDKLIRISDSNTNAYNVGLVIKAYFNI